MATFASAVDSKSYAEDQPFFVKLSIVIAIFTVVCFLQLAVRGITDPRTAPVWTHLHGLVMVGWLGFFVVQNITSTTNVPLHRMLGKAGIFLVILIFGLAWYTVLKSHQMYQSLPLGRRAWDLSRQLIAVVAFLGLVIAGIVARRDTQHHRRFMLGATVAVAINPAVSRLLPIAYSGSPRSGWLIAAIELVLLALLLRHDKRVLGGFHTASIWVGGVIVAAQMAMIAGAHSSSMKYLAERLVQG